MRYESVRTSDENRRDKRRDTIRKKLFASLRDENEIIWRVNGHYGIKCCMAAKNAEYLAIKHGPSE